MATPFLHRSCWTATTGDNEATTGDNEACKKDIGVSQPNYRYFRLFNYNIRFFKFTSAMQYRMWKGTNQSLSKWRSLLLPSQVTTTLLKRVFITLPKSGLITYGCYQRERRWLRYWHRRQLGQPS